LAKEGEAPNPQVMPHFDLEKMSLPEKPEERCAFFDMALLDLQAKVWAFLYDDITDKGQSFSGAGTGTVFGEAAGTYKSDQPMAEPRIALTVEHYNRIAR
jgi:hypothetical protein